MRGHCGVRLTLAGGPAAGAVKPCVPGGPLTLAAGARHPPEADLACRYGQSPAQTAVLAVGVGWRRPGCCWRADSDGRAGGLGVSELWLMVRQRARPDRWAGFAEEDGEVPGATMCAFPAAEAWARDCGDQGATVCRPEAWWSVGGAGPGRWPADWTWDQGPCSWLQSLELEFEEAVPGAGEEAGAVSW